LAATKTQAMTDVISSTRLTPASTPVPAIQNPLEAGSSAQPTGTGR